MARELREYQRLALQFLQSRPRANLFAGMGLGKTATCETLVQSLELDRPTLVLAPFRVARKTWADEIHEWEHLRHLKVATIIGDPQDRVAALCMRAHIHCINYENAEWLIEQIPADRWPFGMVIADESTRLKGFRLRQGGKRAGALATIAHRTPRWYNLTGTPASAGLHDLWGPQWFIDGGKALGASFSAFEQRWFYKPVRGSEHTRSLPFDHAQREIEQALKPTTMSIRAEDWFDVQKPLVTPVRVQLPAAVRREYKRMARDLLAFLQDGTTVRAAMAAVKSTKLLQLASGAVYREDGTWAHVHDEKIEALRSVIEECAGAPLLVAYAYRHELERILKAFPFARQIKSAKDEDAWNAGKIVVGVMHPESAGHGLNLQHGGHRLAYFGFQWKREPHLQILERIGPVRQMQSGYARLVYVYNIIAENTLDDAVLAVHAGSASMMDALMTNLRATA